MLRGKQINYVLFRLYCCHSIVALLTDRFGTRSSVGAARKVSPNWSRETMTCELGLEIEGLYAILKRSY